VAGDTGYNVDSVIQWLVTLVWTVDSYALGPRPLVFSMLALWCRLCGKAVG